MPNYIQNILLSTATGLGITFILMLAVLFVFFPLGKNVLSMKFEEEEEYNELFFIKNNKKLKKMVIFIAFALMFIQIAFAMVSPSNAPKNTIIDNNSVEHRFDRLSEKRSNENSNKEITTEGVLDPMENTGEISRQRIYELSEYQKTEESSENEDEDEDNQPE